MKKLGDLIWFLITWGLLVTAVCAVVIGFYLYNRVDEEIRTQVESLLAEQYPEQEVTVGSARLIELEGFEIRHVSLTPKDASGGGAPVAVADEVLVRCNPRLEELLRGRLEVEEVVARRVTVRCSRQRDGGWTIQQLAKVPTLGGNSLPTVRLENSTLEVIDTYQTPQRIYTLRDVNVLVKPVPSATRGGTPQMSLQASASGDHLQRFTIQGAMVPETGEFRMACDQVRIDLSPALRDSLPVEWGKHIGNLGSLVAKSDLNFDIGFDPRRPTPLAFSLKGVLHNGHLEDPRLPYPLTDISAEFRCNQDKSVVDKIQARYGGATIDLSIQQQGSGAAESMVAWGTVKNFTLREDLISRLSPQIQQQWKKFQPTGNCDADFAFSLQNGQWTPSVEVVCHDVSLTWDKFRYPLTNTKGTISIRAAELGFDLRSLGAPQPIQIRGHVKSPGPNWVGWFEAHSEGPIPLDETLVAAGSDKLQKIVRPFAARGHISFATRSERNREDQPISKSAAIQLVDCTMQHEKFQYPLNGVTGRLEMTNDNWKFKELAGRNDTALIRGEGSWDKDRDGGFLSMFFEGTDIPLEGELRNALPDGAQRTWQNLRPRGTLDHLAARYELAPVIGHASVAVDLKQWQSSGKDLDQTLSILPKSFPYRVDDVTGTVLYHDGKLTMTGMRGQHGAVRFSTNGTAGVVATGGWNLEFTDFHADRLPLDAELLKAAPARLSRAISRMGLKGATSLDGKLQLSSVGPEARIHSAWDLSVDLEDATLGNRWKLEHIVGAAKLVGKATDAGVLCNGSIAIDSMTTRGVQFANITSPIWFDGNRVLLGSWAQPTGSGTPRPLTAKVLGGTLRADAQVMMDDLGSFETSLRIDDANLAVVARDLKLPVARVAGLASATLALRGSEQGRQTWRGKGAVLMRDTDLYELPIVLSLVKTLRTGSTDRTAFDEVAADFRIQGEHTYLDRIDLRGDALTLKGAGELNRQRDVSLNFYTIVGRENAYIQAVRPLLGMASRRFMLVKVRGPLGEPTMTREMLPGLNETLQEWFPEAGSIPQTGGAVERASYERPTGARR